MRLEAFIQQLHLGISIEFANYTNRDLFEEDFNPKQPEMLSKQGSHIYWKTWKNIVHLENLEKSWNFAKNNKNHGNIMEFYQSDIFLIR